MSRAHQSPFARGILRRMMRQRAAWEHGDAEVRTSPLLPDWTLNLHPAIRAEAEALVDAGALPLHDYAHALNSSQAFAMNLFLPLRIGRREALADFLGDALGRAVRVDGVELEFYGSGDILAEISGSTPSDGDMLTAADVAVHLTDADGNTGLLLVEVKLSENGFTPCGGVTSRGNRDHAPCHSAALFFQEPDRCYLRRPWRATRDRRYWRIFTRAHGDLRAAFPGAALDAPCPFVGDWQQPMRNHALCLGAVQEGLADFWALALVHHDGNPDVPAPWDAYAAASADGDHIHRWHASTLLDAIDAALPRADPRLGDWLRDRDFLEESP